MLLLPQRTFRVVQGEKGGGGGCWHGGRAPQDVAFITLILALVSDGAGTMAASGLYV